MFRNIAYKIFSYFFKMFKIIFTTCTNRNEITKFKLIIPS